MTTTVIVKANHGWPVDVTPKRPDGSEAGPTVRVAPSAEQAFHIHSHQDLHIHEVQPDVPEDPTSPAPESEQPADA